MNRLLLGAFGAMVLLAIGLFWLQGRAQVEEGAPPPAPPAASRSANPEALPTDFAEGARGAAPPEVDQISRDQSRFFRLDRNRDGRVTRNERLSTRTSAFRRLDTDGNNLLTFEEWAVATSERFTEMDTSGDGIVTLAETTAYYRRQEQ
jgi:hypothetical protein